MKKVTTFFLLLAATVGVYGQTGTATTSARTQPAQATGTTATPPRHKSDSQAVSVRRDAQVKPAPVVIQTPPASNTGVNTPNTRSGK